MYCCRVHYRSGGSWPVVHIHKLKKQGRGVFRATVRKVRLRHDLETMKKPLNALGTKMAEEKIILTEAQLHTPEKARQTEEAGGEIMTEHPRYLGARGTNYVGSLKGVTLIYQKTFIDTCTTVAMQKPYDPQNAILAADPLHDRVTPSL